MPNMADITVKKADGTTSIVYTAVKPSAGDKVPAIWRSNTGASFGAGKPELQCIAREASGGAQRIVTWKLVMPETYTDTTTGLVAVRYKDVGSAVFTVDQRIADSFHSELAAQFPNLIASALAQDVNKTGFAPN